MCVFSAAVAGGDRGHHGCRLGACDSQPSANAVDLLAQLRVLHFTVKVNGPSQACSPSSLASVPPRVRKGRAVCARPPWCSLPCICTGSGASS